MKMIHWLLYVGYLPSYGFYKKSSNIFSCIYISWTGCCVSPNVYCCFKQHTIEQNSRKSLSAVVVVVLAMSFRCFPTQELTPESWINCESYGCVLEFYIFNQKDKWAAHVEHSRCSNFWRFSDAGFGMEACLYICWQFSLILLLMQEVKRRSVMFGNTMAPWTSGSRLRLWQLGAGDTRWRFMGGRCTHWVDLMGFKDLLA